MPGSEWVAVAGLELSEEGVPAVVGIAPVEENLSADRTVQKAGIEMGQTAMRGECLGNRALAGSGRPVDGDNPACVLRERSAWARPQIAIAAQNPSRTRLGQLVWISSETVKRAAPARLVP